MIDPIFLLEAAINGVLLGGVLALLALGLNLIFGVLDVVWIAYVDLVMVCMYLVYFLVMGYGWPVWLGGLAGIGLGVLLGLAVHVPHRPPDLAATGSVNPPINLPVVEVGGLFLSFARLIAFALSIVAMLGLWVFLRRTFIGTAIRAVAQDRGAMALMGADPQRIYLVTSGVGGAMAGLAAALLSIQYSVHPYFGAAFGPITFMVCVLGGLGNMLGAFIASFVMSEIISLGGVLWSTEMGYVIAFALFIVMMFIRPGGILARRER